VVGKNAQLTLSVAMFVLGSGAIAAAPAESYVVDGACREGVAQGRYELRTSSGALRVTGAFNHGRRTGSFIFWEPSGARVAHIPYDEDARNGTLATWYEGAVKGAEPARRYESTWRHGARDGPTRTWFRNGHRRTEADFAQGALVTATAWSDAGAKLTDRTSREIVERDATAADAYYADLEALVRTHLPQCD
jgi:antitoxin component YwqK of YwqJK toxin-antitoxin module